MNNKRIVEKSAIYCPDGSSFETDLDWETLNDLVAKGFGVGVFVSDGGYRVEYWLEGSKETWSFEFVVSHGSVVAHKRKNNFNFYFLVSGKVIFDIYTLEEAERYLKLQAFL